MPKSVHCGAIAVIRKTYGAEDVARATAAVAVFERDYQAKAPKAAAKITGEQDVLLDFYRYPAAHWVHLRTTNFIESTLATVRFCQRVTKGPGSRAAGLAMAHELI